MDKKLSQFMGLNNVSDPLTLALGHLATADNIDITDAGKPTPRAGYDLTAAGAVTGAYGTLDHQRMFYVIDGNLTAMDGAVVIATDLAGDRMHWAEFNGQIYYSNGTDYGIVDSNNVLRAWAWTVPGMPTLAAVTGNLPPGKYDVCCTYVFEDGRETGSGIVASLEIGEGQALQISNIPQADGMTTLVYIAPANSTVFQLAYRGRTGAAVWNHGPNALGRNLTTFGLDPVPPGDVIQFWGGRMYVAQFFPSQLQPMSAIWKSLSLTPHLFDMSTDMAAVSGEVLMMAPTPGALLIGTDTDIYALNNDGLVTLATYGVVPGCCWAMDDEDPDKRVLFWTQRGLCRGMPFENLMADRVSVAPGLSAGAAVIAKGGQKRFVVALHEGGISFNQR